MPLSFFDPKTLSHFREVIGESDAYGHTFGGDASTIGIRFVNCEPLHLLYRLNQADPAVALNLPGLNWLPLIYHFSYASFDGTLIYRVLNDMEIEIVAPSEATHDPHFPSANFPESFPKSSIAFRNQNHDSTKAESALKLAAIFGLDNLSKSEMKRAIKIADENLGTVKEWTLPGWRPEDIIRAAYPRPFVQGAPSKSCDNPDCTAEIAYHEEATTIPMDEAYQELTGESSISIEAHDVRRDSMRVFAIHQPDQGDKRIWPDVQLVFEVCECCHCIRVTNQCT